MPPWGIGIGEDRIPGVRCSRGERTFHPLDTVCKGRSETKTCGKQRAMRVYSAPRVAAEVEDEGEITVKGTAS